MYSKATLYSLNSIWIIDSIFCILKLYKCLFFLCWRVRDHHQNGNRKMKQWWTSNRTIETETFQGFKKTTQKRQTYIFGIYYLELWCKTSQSLCKIRFSSVFPHITRFLSVFFGHQARENGYSRKIPTKTNFDWLMDLLE